LSGALYRSGDFVWIAFPQREDPATPGPRHIGYIALEASLAGVDVVYVTYTSSQLWSGPRPPGVFNFDREAAVEMGQRRPFTIDLRRVAFVPTTPAWFPDLTTPGNGIVGRASEQLRLALETSAVALFRRSPEIIERLGPLWPRGA